MEEGCDFRGRAAKYRSMRLLIYSPNKIIYYLSTYLLSNLYLFYLFGISPPPSPPLLPLLPLLPLVPHIPLVPHTPRTPRTPRTPCTSPPLPSPPLIYNHINTIQISRYFLL